MAINQSAIDRVASILGNALEMGGRLVIGGQRLSGVLAEGFYYSQTIAAEVDPNGPLAQNEVFGPALGVIAFRDEAHALQIANGTTQGLSGYTWTLDLGRGRLAESMETGEVEVNGASNATGERPFGVIGHSGVGNEGGLEGLGEYLRT